MQQLMSRGIGYSLCVLVLIAATFSVVGAQQIQYGVYIGDQSVVNPNPNYNLYSAGANSKNVFEGKVGIGTTANTDLNARLTVDYGDNWQLDLKNSGVGGITWRIGSTADNWFTSGGKLLFARLGGPPSSVALAITSSDNVGIGTTNPTSRLYVVGDITATGVKNFQIAHPVEPERKLLIHSALEGPEAAVYYRGEAQLQDGKVVIALPAYFEALTRKGARTVQLTPIDGWSPLYVVEGVQDGQFTVRAGKGGNLSQRFYWEVKAVRADVPTLVVEKLKAAD